MLEKLKNIPQTYAKRLKNAQKRIRNSSEKLIICDFVTRGSPQGRGRRDSQKRKAKAGKLHFWAENDSYEVTYEGKPHYWAENETYESYESYEVITHTFVKIGKALGHSFDKCSGQVRHKGTKISRSGVHKACLTQINAD